MDEGIATARHRLRLAVPPEAVAGLQSHPLIRALTRERRPRSALLEVTWFDTAGRDLTGAGLALRLRRSDRSVAQHVAHAADLPPDPFARGSGEATLTSDAPDLERIPLDPLRERVTGILAGRPLEPLFEVAVRRTRRVLEEDGCVIESFLDAGEIRAAGHQLPLHVLQLELREGPVEALHRLALELQEEIPLRLESLSPRQRGAGLATGEQPTPQKAGALTLAPDASVEDLLGALVQSGLEQVLANEGPARAGDDPEGVHQLRVGVRRLRATLALFGRMLPERDSRILKQELRWLGGSLGPARDLDVVLTELLEPVARRFPDDGSLKRLRDEARELREDAYVQVRAGLDSRRQARLGLLLHRWWATRAWRDQRLSPEAARLFAPAADQVAVLLEKRHRRALRLGAGVTQRPVADRHVLRIYLKKLRYATDAAQSLFPRKRTPRYRDRLTKLQEVLGHLNDAAVVDGVLAQVVARLGAEASADLHRAAGFATGWAARGADQRLRRLDRLWKGFAASRAFWQR